MRNQVEPDRVIEIGAAPIRIEHVVAVARGEATLALTGDPAWAARMERSRQVLEEHVSGGNRVYGVTTGFGESCLNPVEAAYQQELARNLVRFHGCGTGRILSEAEGLAVLVVRLAALARAGSAVRPVVVERLVDMVNHRIVPCIPAEGSVGASGDLTPLSYVAATLSGEREVWFGGEQVPAAAAFAAVGLEPVTLQPKESLALMNGTSVMAALGCLALHRAHKLVRLAAAQTAIASDVMRGNAAHFDARIFEAKPHPGQARVAGWIRDHLDYDRGTHTDPERIQDRYSIRCAPHVIGVLADALPMLDQFVETEVNSVNDNPVVDPETGGVLHGGNFYGGHVAWAMDGLKAAVASIADLLDRQLELMGNPHTNNGLPANLVAPGRPGMAASHGFKAMQIATSALAAEALKLTMPAASFSRSTESHNQDKVSMGTIAARDALRVLDLAERAAAIHLIAACQAVDLRGPTTCTERSQQWHTTLREVVKPTDRDRRHDLDINAVVSMLHADALPLPA